MVGVFTAIRLLVRLITNRAFRRGFKWSFSQLLHWTSNLLALALDLGSFSILSLASLSDVCFMLASYSSMLVTSITMTSIMTELEDSIFD